MSATTTSMQVTQFINASRQKVFEAWSNPEIARKWFAPEGCKTVSLEADLREGGAFRGTMNCGGKIYTAFGTYKTINPPEKLAFTHQWDEADSPETLVVIDLTEQDGGTLVTLTQTGFTRLSAAQGHEEGWGSSLRVFKSLVEAL